MCDYKEVIIMILKIYEKSEKSNVNVALGGMTPNFPIVKEEDAGQLTFLKRKTSMS